MPRYDYIHCPIAKRVSVAVWKQILDLVGCKLKQLPDQITYLGKLVELDVSANLLESLPEAFGLLPRLNELKANNNALTDLPVSIACIPHLQVTTTFSLASLTLTGKWRT
jgi:Leucine-rich repeat (LRR) protein